MADVCEGIEGKVAAVDVVRPGKSKSAEKSELEEFEYMEGGWGWVVVIASSYCFGILYGMVGNYALVFNKFVLVYNETENHVLYAGELSRKLFLCFLCL